MKRTLFYIVILVIITLNAIYLLKPQSKLSRSIDKRITAIARFVEAIHESIPRTSSSLIKPTIKVHAINYEYPADEINVTIFKEVLQEKYNIKYTNKGYDLLITGFLDNEPIPTDPNIIKVHYTAEVHIGDPKQHLDTHDLVMAYDFIDHPNYIRVPYAYMRHNASMRHDYDRGMTCNPSGKKYFACFLVSNSGEWMDKFDGALARNRLFHKLSLYKRVASGGKHLNNMPGGKSIPYGETDAWLPNCKFIIAYENQINYPGYVTEKPFQAWFAGGVPLYNTHRSGLADMNPRAVIYAGDFSTEDAFIEYIKKVDNDDELYCKIWNQHILSDPSKDYAVLKEHIRKKLDAILDKKMKK